MVTFRSNNNKSLYVLIFGIFGIIAIIYVSFATTTILSLSLDQMITKLPHQIKYKQQSANSRQLSGDQGGMTIYVRNGQDVNAVEVPVDATVGDVRNVTGIAGKVLTFGDEKLEDLTLLADAGIGAEATIDVKDADKDITYFFDDELGRCEEGTQGKYSKCPNDFSNFKVFLNELWQKVTKECFEQYSNEKLEIDIGHHTDDALQISAHQFGRAEGAGVVFSNKMIHIWVENADQTRQDHYMYNVDAEAIFEPVSEQPLDDDSVRELFESLVKKQCTQL